MVIPVIQNPTEYLVNIINRLNPFGEHTDPFKDDFFRSLAWRPMARLMDDQPMMRIDLMRSMRIMGWSSMRRAIGRQARLRKKSSLKGSVCSPKGLSRLMMFTRYSVGF